MKKKKNLTAKYRVALGQVGLLVSLILVAYLVGLLPSRQNEVRKSRATFAEATALHVSDLIADQKTDRLKSFLKFIVERNPSLLSARIQTEDEKQVFEAGPHREHWTPMLGEYSSNKQLFVPLFAGEERWGNLQLRYESANKFGFLDFGQSQLFLFVVFISAGGFIVFYIYLGKMLKHLDPSKAIPQRVKSALDTMAEGLIVLDLKGQIVLANEAFAALLGKDLDSLIGYSSSDFPWLDLELNPLDDRDAPWSICLRSSEPIRNYEIRLRDRNEKVRCFFVNCSPILSGKKLGGVLVSLDDVTDLEEKKTELSKAKDDAIAANKSKSEFLANMSHEIRTPMNAILGFTDVLRRGYDKSAGDSRKYLNTIHSSGSHLLNLINDILDLSKVESGKFEVEQIECQPHLIAYEVLQILTAKANEKGIHLELESTGKIPDRICSDPARIRQIITNLVGNAIKFTEEGVIKVVLAAEENSDNQLRIEVHDCGIGMTEDQCQRIFDPFSQADTSTTRKFGGTGLGLTISRKFAEALGGSISVTSQPNVGSVFTVLISMGSSESAEWISLDEFDGQPLDDAEENTSWEFVDKRVLVVDDGPENRDLVCLVLQQAGIETDWAENGKVGSDKALANHYDLVLMDMQMPVMDGYTATRRLRDHGYSQPIYALTAHAMSGFEQGCLDAGCTGYLTKPIDIELLLSTLGKVMGGRQVSAEKAAFNRSVKPIPETGKPEQSSPAEKVTNEVGPRICSSLPVEVPEIREIVTQFIDKLSDRLDEMENEWNEGNLTELANHAHWLKGCGGTVGFAHFTEPSRNLEAAAKSDDQAQIELSLMELRALSKRLAVTDSDEASANPEESLEAVEDSEPIESTLPMNDPKYVEIVHRFVARLRERMNEAFGLIDHQAFGELKETGHWLKGCGGNLGFDVLFQLGAELEEQAANKKLDDVKRICQSIVSVADRIQVPELAHEN